MTSDTMVTGLERVQAPRNWTMLGWCMRRSTPTSAASCCWLSFSDALTTCRHVSVRTPVDTFSL